MVIHDFLITFYLCKKQIQRQSLEMVFSVNFDFGCGNKLLISLLLYVLHSVVNSCSLEKWVKRDSEKLNSQSLINLNSSTPRWNSCNENLIKFERFSQFPWKSLLFIMLNKSNALFHSFCALIALWLKWLFQERQKNKFLFVIRLWTKKFKIAGALLVIFSVVH